jgi:hypothetical protein
MAHSKPLGPQPAKKHKITHKLILLLILCTLNVHLDQLTYILPKSVQLMEYEDLSKNLKVVNKHTVTY